MAKAPSFHTPPRLFIPTVVVIPTRDNALTSLPHLLSDLDKPLDMVFIMDNNPFSKWDKWTLCSASRGFNTDKMHILRCPGKNIYDMWQHGWDAATAMYPGEFNLAILNDDIRLPKSALPVMTEALRGGDADYDWWVVYPDYDAKFDTHHYDAASEEHPVLPTHGTYRHGGMSGWCFMVKGELQREGRLPRLDTEYEWWYGDDDLAFTIEKYGGHQGRVHGLPCHHDGEGTASLPHHRDWTSEAKTDDERRFKHKWAKP